MNRIQHYFFMQHATPDYDSNRYDPTLGLEGIAQAKLQQKFLEEKLRQENISELYAMISPLRRTQETAEIVTQNTTTAKELFPLLAKSLSYMKPKDKTPFSEHMHTLPIIPQAVLVVAHKGFVQGYSKSFADFYNITLPDVMRDGIFHDTGKGVYFNLETKTSEIIPFSEKLRI